MNGSGSLSAPTDTPSPPGMALGEGFGDQPLGPVAVTGLAAGKTFYYQAVAVNATGTTYGAVQSFSTAPAPAPSPISTTTATFHGEVALSPSVATQYSFDYNVGSECIDGSSTPMEEAGQGSGTVAEHASVSELQPGVEYTGVLCRVERIWLRTRFASALHDARRGAQNRQRGCLRRKVDRGDA